MRLTLLCRRNWGKHNAQDFCVFTFMHLAEDTLSKATIQDIHLFFVSMYDPNNSTDLYWWSLLQADQWSGALSGHRDWGLQKVHHTWREQNERLTLHLNRAQNDCTTHVNSSHSPRTIRRSCMPSIAHIQRMLQETEKTLSTLRGVL